jgi:hypothetical protein
VHVVPACCRGCCPRDPLRLGTGLLALSSVLAVACLALQLSTIWVSNN